MEPFQLRLDDLFTQNIVLPFRGDKEIALTLVDAFLIRLQVRVSSLVRSSSSGRTTARKDYLNICLLFVSMFEFYVAILVKIAMFSHGLGRDASESLCDAVLSQSCNLLADPLTA